MKDSDYADDLELIANTPTKAKTKSKQHDSLTTKWKQIKHN